MSSTEEAAAQTSSATSALQDNIQRKGNHAYYFAHANKPNGPEWDGKAEPRLLEKKVSDISDIPRTTTPSSFDFKSNITSYAFSDQGKAVKLYITLEGLEEKCSDEDITLEHTENSFCLMVNKYKQHGEPACLSFLRLTAPISAAKFRKKQDRIILTLTKVDAEKEWHTINDKGQPDHEVV